MMKVWTAFLLICAAASVVAWVVALCHENRVCPFGAAARFVRGLPWGGRLAVLPLFVALIVYGSVKQGNVVEDEPVHAEATYSADSESNETDNSKLLTLNSQLSSPISHLSSPTSGLAITDFGVDSLSKAIAFEIAWADGLFDYAVSRSLYLLMSTNLLERSWITLGQFSMPPDTNAFAFAVTSNDVPSFQIALPTNVTDKAYVRYRNMTGKYADSGNVDIGMQTFDGRWLHSYCNNQAGKVHEGDELTFLFGKNTNPLVADTDMDGLADGNEVAMDIDPTQPDTDGDGMNDGWEDTHRDSGFDPASRNEDDDNPDNDLSADPDGDGLTNGEECESNTNPSGADGDGDGAPDGFDSDGDGVGDGVEMGQNSDPADASDGGSPNSRASVPFTFGDPSESHSEKYRLEFTPVSGIGDAPSSFYWINENYGQCSTRTARLKPGWTYEIRLFHVGTDPNYSDTPNPDYDYRLRCDDEDLPDWIVISDPDGLFAGDSVGSSFTAQGKVATISVYAITDVAICKPDGSSWAELEESRVVLDDEELRIKIGIAPSLDSLSQCRRMFGDSITVKTSGTCPEGVSVPVPDDATIATFSGRCEIRISKTRQQLIDLGLLPSKDDDGVSEMAWMDMGSADFSQPSNLTDSEAFSSLGYQFRGKATGDSSKSLDATPPNSIPSESFFKAAGCEVVFVEYGGLMSRKRQIINQADIFYYSGHGSHATGAIQGGFSPSMALQYWNRDLDCAIFAGCSVLDINDHNGNYIGTSEHMSSPGRKWANIKGLEFLLGYAYVAPLDTQGADRIASAWVANRGSMDDTVAWMKANDNRNGRNACAIQRIDDSHIRYSYFKREKGFLYNSYLLTNVIERISQ